MCRRYAGVARWEGDMKSNPEQVIVMTRMLTEGEEGLGAEENQPPVGIDAEVRKCSAFSTTNLPR